MPQAVSAAAMSWWFSCAEISNTAGSKRALHPNIFLMLSPYYCRLLAERFDLDLAQVIYPNHANICCGLGLCGACSHTDADGVTVRACKCSEISSC